MTYPDVAAPLRAFDTAIAKASSDDAVFAALHGLADAVAGAKLFTVMTVDMPAGLARRAYTSDTVNYPGAGTKPIVHNSWFDVVHKERRTFVANTIDAIADVFPDYALIDSLGCQSVVNLPVVLGDELVATVNMLDVEGHYTPERVAAIETYLSVPAKLACLLTRRPLT
ncbi:GAF domain-containing protein [Pelagibacterium xiamenense]|uniref:GAF domain-containing protein n=1 Tax=Pelagibacterium xiamenense TaxID=2901140 RepID=UPI001E636BFD|nr:GAF domain-containing protein [Pelagibacterium xiamenense]MCD7059540.1 GAF domain-containing protein [Pelagibacterium xiamenense]